MKEQKATEFNRDSLHLIAKAEHNVHSSINDYLKDEEISKVDESLITNAIVLTFNPVTISFFTWTSSVI